MINFMHIGRTRKRISRLLTVLIPGMVVWLSHPTAANAALVGFSGFNGQIVRSGAMLDFPQTSTLPGLGEAGDVTLEFVKDLVNDEAIAYSASSNGQVQLYQHVYAYTMSDSMASYQVSNKTANTVSTSFSAEAASVVKGFTVRDGQKRYLPHQVRLDGTILLAAQADQKKLKGLKALFEIEVFKEWEKPNGKTVSRRAFGGKVLVKANNRGQIKVGRRGRIRKSMISSVEVTDGIVAVHFNDVTVPYGTRVPVGETYNLRTEMNSLVVNLGAGTGGEINFSPAEPTLPVIVPPDVVPEPMTICLLLLGGLGWRLRRPLTSGPPS